MNDLRRPAFPINESQLSFRVLSMRALFPKRNLQPLSFGRLDDGFDFCVYEPAARQFHGDMLADFEVLYLGSGQPESNSSRSPADAISGFQDFKSRREEISIGCWPFNTCKLNAASRTARCSSMSQLLVVSSLARWEIAASAMAIFSLNFCGFTSTNAARYGFCHSG